MARFAITIYPYSLDFALIFQARSGTGRTRLRGHRIVRQNTRFMPSVMISWPLWIVCINSIPASTLLTGCCWHVAVRGEGQHYGIEFSTSTVAYWPIPAWRPNLI